MTLDDDLDAALDRQDRAQAQLAEVIAQKRELLDLAVKLVQGATAAAQTAVAGSGIPVPGLVNMALDKLKDKAVAEIATHRA